MLGIISGYRTGSTTLIQELSTTLNITYNREFTGELDFVHNEFSYPEPINQIYKIMPTDNNLLGETRDLFYKHWLDNTFKLFYTVRNDITAQIKSWALASKTHRFHPFELSEVYGRHLDTDSIHVSRYNNANNTEFETIKECQSHINDTFDESFLLTKKDNIISTMQNQYEIYQKYKGTVYWLETRAKTNNKRYPKVFSLPPCYDSWHCGSVGEQYFKD
jgi:hypothetical protein